MKRASSLLCAIALICGFSLLVSVPAGAAPACLEPGGMGGTGAVATGGIGGTGAPQQDGGLGGTGAPAQHGGIGGTGAPADEGGIGGTGIVGTITGFGSICVNGVEVHFDSNAVLTENGVPASSKQLAIGQVVAVEARSSPRGLEARNIAILHAYEGPVTEVAPGAASLRVMGQPVRLAVGARVASGLRIGDPVRVSGLRDAQGQVLASRIDRAPGLVQASAIGAIERPGVLQGLALSKPLPASAEMLVRGTWNGRQLNVIESRADPGLFFGGRVRNALVEGLVRSQHGNRVEFGGFTAYLGQGTAFADGQQGELAVGERIRVSGVFEKGRNIRADRIEIFHERPGDSRGQGSGHEKSGAVEATQGERDNSGHGSSETRERTEQRQESATGNLERRVRIETRDSADRLETRERIEVFENGVRVERIERIEKIERSDRVDTPEKIERIEKVERVERPEAVERPETVERVDHSGPH